MFIDLKETLRLCVTSIKNLVCFSAHLHKQGKQTFAIPSLEQEILTQFYLCFTKLFSNRFLSLITQEYPSINNNELVYNLEFNPKLFLQVFSVGDIALSELVWNEETRQELAQITNEQITFEDDLFSKISEF